MNGITKLIVLHGPSPGAEFELSSRPTTLGREAPADILLPAQGVSRAHARIILQGDTCLLEDLGSTNGTFINSDRIAAPTPLNAGDFIGLGQSVVLEFQTGTGAAPRAVSPTPAEALATVLGDVAPHEGGPPPQ